MGYYTRYKLEVSVVCPDDAGIKVVRPHCNHAVIDGAPFCHVCGKPVFIGGVAGVVWDYIEGLDPHKSSVYYALVGGDQCKWYFHNTNMLEISQMFPRALLTLSGEGEDSGDLWRTYYHNGKKHTAKAVITYPDFDPTLLRSNTDDTTS